MSEIGVMHDRGDRRRRSMLFRFASKAAVGHQNETRLRVPLARVAPLALGQDEFGHWVAPIPAGYPPPVRYPVNLPGWWESNAIRSMETS
jgi:hypothetical protein